MSANPALPGTSAPGALGFILSLAGWRRLAMLAILMTLVALSEGIGLLMLVPLAQSVVGGENSFFGGWLPRLPLAYLLAVFVMLVAARSFLAYLNQNLQRDVAIDSIRRLRGAMRDAVMKAEWRWLAGQSGAEHTALIMGMAEKIGYMAIQVLQLAAACVTLAILLSTALALSWQLTSVILVLGILIVVPTVLLRMRPIRDGKAYTAAYSRLQSVLQQGIAHLRAARIAGAGDAVSQEFVELSHRVGEIEKRHGRKVVSANLMVQILAALGLAVIVWVAIERLETPLPLLLPVMAIFARAVPLANTIQQGVRGWQFGRPAIEEMQALIAGAREAAEPEAVADVAPSFRHTLELRDVTVRYPGRSDAVIDGLSLTIPANGIVAITGPSGSGKSTLADIVGGLLLPDEGQVLVDGELLTSTGRIAWRRHVAYVEQAPFIFDDTVRANLGWGREGISEDDISAALRAASAEFVFALPAGIDTNVGETGRQLSGGERQRIALARALLRKPNLLILDETTSAIDADTEAMIASSIRELKGSMAIIILGHRPAMTELADEVISLGGRRS